jgi:hypothetical protein
MKSFLGNSSNPLRRRRVPNIGFLEGEVVELAKGFEPMTL